MHDDVPHSGQGTGGRSCRVERDTETGYESSRALIGVEKAGGPWGDERTGVEEAASLGQRKSPPKTENFHGRYGYYE